MGLDDLFQSGDESGVSFGEGLMSFGGFAPAGGVAANEGISPAWGEASSGLFSGDGPGLSGRSSWREPDGGAASASMFGIGPNYKTLEYRDPRFGTPPDYSSGWLPAPPKSGCGPLYKTLEYRDPRFGSSSGFPGQTVFANFDESGGGGSGHGGSPFDPANDSQPPTNAFTSPFSDAPRQGGGSPVNDGGMPLAGSSSGNTANDVGGGLTRNVNGELPQNGPRDGSSQTADQKASIEEQRKQWEFDKGLETEAKRNRMRPTTGKTNSPYDESRFHPKEKKYKPHRAVDLRSPEGGVVVAASDGTVNSADNNGKGNLGNHVIVDFDDGMRGVYGHTAPSVKPGQRVRKGDPVGNTDLSGATDGPHLHFEVHDPKTGKKINPEAYLPQRLE